MIFYFRSGMTAFRMVGLGEVLTIYLRMSIRVLMQHGRTKQHTYKELSTRYAECSAGATRTRVDDSTLFGWSLKFHVLEHEPSFFCFLFFFVSFTYVEHEPSFFSDDNDNFLWTKVPGTISILHEDIDIDQCYRTLRIWACRDSSGPGHKLAPYY